MKLIILTFIISIFAYIMCLIIMDIIIHILLKGKGLTNMKLIILTFIISIFAFIMCLNTMDIINTKQNKKMFTELHNEHYVMMDKINKIYEKCDGITRIEKLIRQNMSAPYTNDR